MNISGISIQGGVRLSNSDPPVIITGGNVTYDNVYTVRTFTANSNLVITTTQVNNTNPLLNVQYLLIAGGGGHDSSGGGAGGVLSGNTVLSLGTYPVIIGQKGNRFQNGGNSIFNNLTSVGGGAGVLPGNGQPGGSGGGGSVGLPGIGTYVGGQGVPGQGFPGGGAAYGGGGGAGQAGADGGTGGPGAGGNGIQSNITGVLQYYAGGGNGLASTGSAGLGQNNYGGGSQRVATAPGGGDTNAQPGVLIIRYPTQGTK